MRLVPTLTDAARHLHTGARRIGFTGAVATTVACAMTLACTVPAVGADDASVVASSGTVVRTSVATASGAAADVADRTIVAGTPSVVADEGTGIMESADDTITGDPAGDSAADGTGAGNADVAQPDASDGGTRSDDADDPSAGDQSGDDRSADGADDADGPASADDGTAADTADGTDGADGDPSDGNGTGDASAAEAATALYGRDVEGQAAATINGRTYILIGSAQQLRAIGTGAKVTGRVWSVEQKKTGSIIGIGGKWEDVEGTERIAYDGDADLAADGTLANRTYENSSLGTSRLRYYTLDAQGERHDVDESDNTAGNTGLTYDADADYLIFRDIDLGSGQWTPLMFSGTMIGAIADEPDTAGTLWSRVDAAGDAATDGTARPVISNVTIHQTGKLDVSKYSGIGFFATLSHKLDEDDPLGGDVQAVHVSNIMLEHVSVTNDSTEVRVDQTLISGLVGGLGTVVGGLLSTLLKILTAGKVNLNGLVENLLTVRAKDPSALAAGAFAGRIVGDVTVTDCGVRDVSVSSKADMTGGFVGYTRGETRYDIVSKLLDSIVSLLSNLLNVIPGIGLGDLITLLLDSNIIDAGALTPVGYLNPVIDGGLVEDFAADTTIGTDTTDYAGGFVGSQIGTIITDAHVRSANAYTVRAGAYAGGFAGLATNDVMKGALSQLGVDLVNVAQPQSATVASDVRAAVTVDAGAYAGGFAGAMANSFAVNDTVSGTIEVKTSGVNGDGEQVAAEAGGFTGVATVGWLSDLGVGEDRNTSLLTGVNGLLTGLLTSNPDQAQDLLSLVGVERSALLGVQVDGDVTVTSANHFAGGLVGRGEGAVIVASDAAHVGTLSFWKHGTLAMPQETRGVSVAGLRTVSVKDSYAGGLAGQLGTASVGGIINDTVGLGGYLPFEVSSATVTGIADGGFTVTAGKDAAGGLIGKATGGLIGKASDAYGDAGAPDSATVTVGGLSAVSARNHAGGFIGLAGPGSLADAGGLDLLGFGLVKVSGLLSVADGLAVRIDGADVEGVPSGMSVTATGTSTDTVTRFAAGGFIGSADGVQAADVHVLNLYAVTADDTSGTAGGFVGISTTGGLAEVADEASIKGLVEIGGANGLINAVVTMTPSYTNADTRFVNGGAVRADVAGGFVGDMQAGKVDDSGKTDDPWAVYNLDTVTGGTYAGGFGGKVHSGALAAADGGISILGGLGSLNIGINDLLSLVNAYVPVIIDAGVRSDDSTVETTSGHAVSDKDNPGLRVTVSRIDTDDADSGSAGGYIGYGSGVRVSGSDVTQLRHTTVTPPADLETEQAASYFDKNRSVYAVEAPRYAGGYIGRMDVGSAASVGDGLNVLGQSINLTDVVSAANAVVSVIEDAEVTGGIAGYAVLADGTVDGDATGMAGGFAGSIVGGHLQNADAHEFAYIIGRIAAGGYAGGMEPGSVADVLGDAGILKKLVNIDSALSLVQDFVPTIRNSSTDAVVCGGVVRAEGTSDDVTRRGMAGGYVGHNRGGHIWGLDAREWHAVKSGFTPAARTAYAARIRSVYGTEIAGGYTGFMEAADTAEGGSLSLLSGLVSVGNLVGVLSLVYPTEEHTKVTGPLRNMSYAQWEQWVANVGRYGAYGEEFSAVVQAGKDQVRGQDSLDAFLDDYIFGFNTVAGRSTYATGANLRDSGVAGGHVGLMRTGTITDGQSQDVRTVRAMRAAGGYAGAMETGSAATFGTVSLAGLKLDLGSLVSTPQVFVPVVKSSSVIGYRKGLRVEATGSDLLHGTGNAGGYVGLAVGAQIWGDRDANGDKPEGDAPAAGADVTNLRKVSGQGNVGGYVGQATAGSVADVDTQASSGFLQGVIDGLIDTANPAGLVSVLQATVATIRGAHVNADDAAWGYTVEGVTAADGTDVHPLNAGGFAGSLQAAVLGDKDGDKRAATSVTALRGVAGGQYAGGYVGLADISSVASVGGGQLDASQNANLLLKLLKVGNVGVLEAFRTYIYDAHVAGVADGIQIRAHESTTKAMLDATRYTGAAGGFAGGVINGTVVRADVTALNAVTGVNYAGGFVGHLGKSGTVSADNAQLGDDMLNVLGATAGVLDIWGSHVTDGHVTGIAAGYAVTATHAGADYGKGTAKPSGREVAGGFVGYADLARIKTSSATHLGKVSSGEIAGGFAGETTRAYLVDAEVNSTLLKLLLKVVNALVKLLYVDDLEHLGVIDLGGWFPNLFGKIFDIKVLSEGDALYVNLFGLKVGVALSKASEENQQETDVAIVTIGDSTIKLPCNENGLLDEDDASSNLTVQLIKGNRTRVESSSVTGTANGYDVFGGGATQETDGVTDLATGYAGGFVGRNDEGVLVDDHMTYADAIRGTSGLVDPFANTLLKSAWDFNTMKDLLGPQDGAYNTYRIYRTADAQAGKAVTSVEDGRWVFSTKTTDTGDGTLDTGYDRWQVDLFDVVNTYDGTIAHGSSGDRDTDWVGIKDAVIATGDASHKPLGAYVSAAKAVLMLDAAAGEPGGGVTPEPDDGQDPCGGDQCAAVDLTLRKVWKATDLERPASVTFTVTASYTDANGNRVTPETIDCLDDACQVVTRKNPWTVTLTAKDHGSAWSDTWRTVIGGLPVAFRDTDRTVRRYTYTVTETSMTFKDGSTKTPAEAGYSTDVSYDATDRVATVTNYSPLPDTGGAGMAAFIAAGLALLALGTAWYLHAEPDAARHGRSGRRGRRAAR